ncbi:threonine/serine dehydratase [Streptomyces sp. NPDC059398]|uniref:threonine ammonia-lyase n=1 Tax=Streptomyces sp. NPDC059398 TaxID=3346820 RepID=UPI0036833354
MCSVLSVENIEEAGRTIAPAFANTPQFEDEALRAALGRRLIVKVETVNPVRSFKGRGADHFMRGLAPGSHVVCASAGNFGLALAWAARHHGITVTVHCAEHANAVKLARMRSLGARLEIGGQDFDEAKERALRQAGEDPGTVFVEDGDDSRITAGAGTIAPELAGLAPDTVLVPVGNGALVNGVGTWFKARSPHTRVVGVCAAGAPAMALSWRAGEAVSTPAVRTAADGVAVRVPVPGALATMLKVVDDMLLVDETAISRAQALAHEHLGLVLEPAGAVALAAVSGAGPGPEVGERPAVILTGGNQAPR